MSQFYYSVKKQSDKIIENQDMKKGFHCEGDFISKDKELCLEEN